MARRKAKIDFYEFHLCNSRWQTLDGLRLSDVIQSDALRLLLMTDYNVLFRLSDSTMSYDIRKGRFRLSVRITRYLN